MKKGPAHSWQGHKHSVDASKLFPPPKSTLRKLFAGIIATTLLVGFSGLVPVGSHDGATGIVKERMETMSEIGDASKIIGDMVKNKIPLDAIEISRLAADIREHAKRIPELFPDTEESRENPVTEAMPAVWLHWDEFESLSNELVEKSLELESVASEGNASEIRRAFANMGRTCRGCHTDFRKPEDD